MESTDRKIDSPAVRTTGDDRQSLDRLMNAAHIADVVPNLQPELLHRVIDRYGLEACGPLLALATPEQLARIFDLDLWRADAAGRDDRFDADRFAEWLAVLLEAGEGVAARTLAQMDPDLAVAGLSRHARVFDRAAVTPYLTLDGEEMTPAPGQIASLPSAVGGYVLHPRQPGAPSWDGLLTALASLAEAHPESFHRLMRGCVECSDDGRERDELVDLLEDDEQVMFDVAIEREGRREAQGFATPPQARAFLETARQVRLDRDTRPPADPIAAAYFRDVAGADDSSVDRSTRQRLQVEGGTTSQDESAEHATAIAAVLTVLHDAGLLGPTPKALAAGTDESAARLSRIEAHLQHALASGASSHAARTAELAFLANALQAGCPLQGRAFTPQEASDAALAVCNLGLERWPSGWRAADDLVAVFQVGWTVLHDDVCMEAAARLIEVLGALRFDDPETGAEVKSLRAALVAHTRAGMPWRARNAMDVLAILDMTAWTTLLALIGECPVSHAALAASRSHALRIDPSAFEFISDGAQVTRIHEFLESLPAVLGS